MRLHACFTIDTFHTAVDDHGTSSNATITTSTCIDNSMDTDSCHSSPCISTSTSASEYNDLPDDSTSELELENEGD